VQLRVLMRVHSETTEVGVGPSAVHLNQLVASGTCSFTLATRGLQMSGIDMGDSCGTLRDPLPCARPFVHCTAVMPAVCVYAVVAFFVVCSGS